MLDINTLGTVSCVLCRARVSVSCGLNGEVGMALAKLRAHLTFDHEVHFDQDILISLVFLEPGEKEVIVEKVMPRIKRTVETVRANVTPGEIERKLKEMFGGDFVNTGEVDSDKKPTSKRKGMVESTENEIQENNESHIPIKKIKKNDSFAKSSARTDLDSSVEEIDVVGHSVDDYSDDEATLGIDEDGEDCDVCNIFIEKSALLSHRETHHHKDGEEKGHPRELLGTGTQTGYDKNSNNKKKIICDICDSSMTRGNLNRHKRNVHGISNKFDNDENSEGLEKTDQPKSVEGEKDSYNLLNLDPENLNPMSEAVDYVMQLLTENRSSSTKDPSVSLTELDSSDLETIERKITDMLDKTSDNDPAKLIKCEQCDNEYSSKANMRRHQMKAHEKQTSSGSSDVPLDDSNFEDQETVEKPVCEDDRDSKLFRCDQCDNEYTLKTSLRRHQIRNHEKKALSIEHSPVTSKENNPSDRGSVPRNEEEVNQTVDGDEPKLFKCDQCDNEYTLKTSLRRHQIKVHEKNTSEIEHLSESSRESNSRDLENLPKNKDEVDKTNEDGEENIFKCDKCSNEYTSKKSLRRHRMKRH